MKRSFFYNYFIAGFFLILLSGKAFSQPYFQKVYVAPYDQEGQDVLPTSDGGFMITGYTTNSILGDMDVLILKTDALGNELWRKTYGGAKPDFSNHMLKTDDGNFFLVGYSYSFGGGDMDMMLMKIDPAGALIWTKTYGANGNDMAMDVIATSDGNYMLVGSSNTPPSTDRNATLIKIDPSGTVIWTKNIGGSNTDFGNCVQQTSDGGYIMIGQTYSFGAQNGDAFLAKLNANGDTTWTKRFGGAQYDEGFYITIAPDGGFVFLVRDSSNVGMDIDARIIKTDPNGNVIWNKVYGGTKKDTPKMIQNTADGGFIIGAISRSFGWVNPDMWILRCNGSGDTLWTRHYGGAQNEHCYVARELSDGSFIAVGKTASYGPTFDPIFLKLNSNGMLTGINEIAANINSPSVYPNPSSGSIRFDPRGITFRSIKVTDVLGNIIYQEPISGKETVPIELPNDKPGIYFLSCESENYKEVKKIIVQ